MPYSRKRSSSYWLIAWAILFFFGMFVFFAFMMGYGITPYGGVINGQYIVSSSNNSVFIDEKFLQQDKDALSLPLGEYEFCFSRYFYKESCLEKEIRTNNYPILMLEDVSILPRNFRTELVANEQVFFDPQKRGLAWYDEQKKVVFVVDKSSLDFLSQEVPENFAGIHLFPRDDKKNGELFLSTFVEVLDKRLSASDGDKKGDENANSSKDKKNTKKTIGQEEDSGEVIENNENETALSQKELPENLGKEGDAFDLLDEVTGRKIKKDSPIVFEESGTILSNIDSIFSREKSKKITPSLSAFLLKNKDEKDELFASFDVSAKEIIPFKKGYLLRFSDSIWVFDFHQQSFRKIVSIDKDSDFLFHEISNSIFYIKQGSLMRLFF
jgi:hypothetical protein